MAPKRVLTFAAAIPREVKSQRTDPPRRRGSYDVYSAGTDPADVRTEAIKVMRELRINFDNIDKGLEDFAGKRSIL